MIASLTKVKRGLVFCCGKDLWLYPPAVAVGGVFLPSAMGRHVWGFNSLVHCLLYGKSASNNEGSKPQLYGVPPQYFFEPTPVRQTASSGCSGRLILEAGPEKWCWIPLLDLLLRASPVFNWGAFIGIEMESLHWKTDARRIEEATKQGIRSWCPPSRNSKHCLGRCMSNHTSAPRRPPHGAWLFFEG